MMALDKIRIANKKWKQNHRRKKVGPRNNKQVYDQAAGNLRAFVDRHNRIAKDNRNHHRKQDGSHTRKSKFNQMERQEDNE